MTWFPVIADEIAAAEAKLGVSLPPDYKKFLLDPRIAAFLATIQDKPPQPTLTMLEFAQLTFQLRANHPEFPTGAVAAFSRRPNGVPDLECGNCRFWLPDPDNPSSLADVLYSMNVTTHKKIRECTTLESLSGLLRGFQGKDSALLLEINGGAFVEEEMSLAIRTRPCEHQLSTLLASRGTDMDQAICGLEDAWLACAQLTVQGSYLSPCDLGIPPYPAPRESVKVSPGSYDVLVRVAKSTLGAWPVVRAVRVVKTGAIWDAKTHALDVSVDVASLCIFDRQALFRQLSPDDREDACEDLMFLEERACVAIFGKDAEAIVVPTGDGDGVYQVYRLSHGKEGVGLEIDFFAPRASGR